MTSTMRVLIALTRPLRVCRTMQVSMMGLYVEVILCNLRERQFVLSKM
jgi:hypothetical protein